MNIVGDSIGFDAGTAVTNTANASGVLTAQSNTDIIMNSGASISGDSTHQLGVTFDADYALGGGAIVINGNITSNGGNITLGGGNSTISAGTGFAVGNVASSGIGININDATVSSGAGNIIINGAGQTSGTNTAGTSGVWVQGGGVVEASSGNITITGNGGGSGNGQANYGVTIGFNGLLGVS